MGALLDDPVFFARFAPHFHPVLGRPSTPVGCHLRLMFFKFWYRPRYESLCAKVGDSVRSGPGCGSSGRRCLACWLTWRPGRALPR